MNIIKAAAKHGVEAIHRGNGHWQLKGPLLVNYYPDSKSKTAYVAGTTRSRKGVTLQKAIAMCFETPKPQGKIDKRRKGYRRERQRLINRGVTTCYWCGVSLTLDTSTLEHIIPLSAGGLDNANNQTLACEPCNQKRGNSMPELSQLKKGETP